MGPAHDRCSEYESETLINSADVVAHCHPPEAGHGPRCHIDVLLSEWSGWSEYGVSDQFWVLLFRLAEVATITM
jgi:hypothetical protein